MQIYRALDFLFGCHHGNLSRVFTIDGDSYRVCCDCGARFQYSLATMTLQQREFSPPAPRLCLVADLKSAHLGR